MSAAAKRNSTRRPQAPKTNSIAKPFAGVVKRHPAQGAKLEALIVTINHGRSKLYVTAQALEHGETDLELQCSRVLQDAYDEIEEAYDELVSLSIGIEAYEREVAHG